MRDFTYRGLQMSGDALDLPVVREVALSATRARNTMSANSTCRGFSPLPRMESCTSSFSRGSTSAHVRLTTWPTSPRLIAAQVARRRARE